MNKKPNILLINCDDMGYGDLGCYGSTCNHTPFIDRLAAEGMRFTSCYASSPVCSPSRAALMTGCFPPRVGVTRVLFPGESVGLNRSEYTMAQMLKDMGYHTMIVGKWHCGDQEEFLPCQHGFDHYYGLPYSNDMGRQKMKEGQKEYPPLPLIHDNTIIQEQPDQKGLTERYTERCIEFIRKHSDEPFFLYMAHMHMHLPLYAADRFYQETENGDFGACMAEVDWSCAAIAAELKRLGIYENTLILFTSDNGSRGDHGASNAPLRGGKFTTWEGGMRVPFIAHWSGHIPQGTVNDGIFCHVDLLPTLAALVGGKLSENKIDGYNQLDAFFDSNGCTRNEMVYFGANDAGGDLNAYRYGDWKLHMRIKVEDCCQLYHLTEDIGETKDCAQMYPEIVEELKKKAAVWKDTLGDKIAGHLGKECRMPGYVKNPKTLTTYREDHPYMIAMYDKDDRG